MRKAHLVSPGRAFFAPRCAEKGKMRMKALVSLFLQRPRWFDLEEAQVRARQGGHLGLWSMRERVNQLGGQFEIESTPGRGTKLTMNIPLQADFAPFSKEA
jgi:signal transduction histidine kinase